MERGMPIGLSPAQLGDAPVTRARQSIPVLAWVPFTGGAYHRVRAYAGEWMHQAVHLRFRDQAGSWDLWVHAIDVERSESPRRVRRLQFLGRMESCPGAGRAGVVRRGTRRS
jgi:hypothetical protein